MINCQLVHSAGLLVLAGTTTSLYNSPLENTPQSMQQRQSIPVMQLCLCVVSQVSISACACSLGVQSRAHRQAQRTAAHHLAEERLSSCSAVSGNHCLLDPGLQYSPLQGCAVSACSAILCSPVYAKACQHCKAARVLSSILICRLGYKQQAKSQSLLLQLHYPDSSAHAL